MYVGQAQQFVLHNYYMIRETRAVYNHYKQSCNKIRVGVYYVLKGTNTPLRCIYIWFIVMLFYRNNGKSRRFISQERSKNIDNAFPYFCYVYQLKSNYSIWVRWE